MDAYQANLRRNAMYSQPAPPGGYAMRLDPVREMLFQVWLRRQGMQDSPDYDYRRLWLTGVDPTMSAQDSRGHFTDEFKTPMHESFSSESRGAMPDAPQWLPSPGGGNMQVDPVTGRRVFQEDAQGMPQRIQTTGYGGV